MARKTGYAAVQIGLHWLTALLILGAYFLSEGMEEALRARIQSGASGIEGNTLHVWLGGAAFLTVLIRLAVRLRLGAPGAPEGTPPLWERGALWGHRLLYALMIVVPMLGSATWYAGRDLGEVHEIAATALVVVAAGHVIMAMLHEALRGDGTMARMFRPGP